MIMENSAFWKKLHNSSEYAAKNSKGKQRKTNPIAFSSPSISPIDLKPSTPPLNSDRKRKQWTPPPYSDRRDWLVHINSTVQGCTIPLFACIQGVLSFHSTCSMFYYSYLFIFVVYHF